MASTPGLAARETTSATGCYEAHDRRPAPDPARIAAHADTCLYFGCPDPDAAYAHLRAHGIAAKEPSVAPYGMKQLYVIDPDGFHLCFQWPASTETGDQWRAWYGIDPDEPSKRVV